MAHASDNPDTQSKLEAGDERKTAILHELDLILDSLPFRSSKRCQQFLRHTVQHALAGEHELLKERSIGIAIFSRQPDYDTGEDSIVRVAAKEVRNRLLQYYASCPQEPAVRIAIAPGSYLPEFLAAETEMEVPPQVLPAPAPARPHRLYAGIAIAAVVVLAAALSFLLRSSGDLLQRFWNPALESPRPILICLANTVVYQIDDEVFKRFGARGPSDPGLLALHIPDDGVIYGREVIPSQDDYLGVGDTLAATRLSILFTRLGKSPQVRASRDISFSDLRNSPSVLIGSFSNAWTFELMKEWRFVFEIPAEREWLIRDRRDPSRVWENPAMHDRLRGRKITEDYALISRVFEQRSGQPVVSVGGITDYGTAAAAEFLSDPALLATAFTDAPKNWDRKNLQIVIRTHVVGRTAGSPQFVARHIW